MLSDILSHLEPAPSDPIIGISDRFQKDPRDTKVNLTVGNYLGADGKIPLQETVAKAEARLLARRTVHRYLPMLGLETYCRALEKLTFGEDSEILTSGRVATCQTIGGTGSLYLGGIFARETLGISHAVVSNPTWGNHISLFKKGGLDVSNYNYFDRAKGEIPFDKMIQDIKALPSRSLVLVHVCCHNPTGMDLSQDQWKDVLDVIRKCDHMAFLDMAYQGFAKGLWEDAYPVRLFAEAGIPFMVSVSMSKGLSLYGERTGTLHIATQTAKEAKVIESLLKRHIRALYSNPPSHGARIAAEVLCDEVLRKEWIAEVDEMRNRVYAMRQGLFREGQKQGVSLDFAIKQNGIFSFTGFSAEEMEYLRQAHGIYGIDSGRIAMAGLTDVVLPHVAAAFADVIKHRS